jgi:Putative Ig domain/Galactose oxidase, central domain/Fibronectin type III domain/Kelch motif
MAANRCDSSSADVAPVLVRHMLRLSSVVALGVTLSVGLVACGGGSGTSPGGQAPIQNEATSLNPANGQTTAGGTSQTATQTAAQTVNPANGNIPLANTTLSTGQGITADTIPTQDPALSISAFGAPVTGVLTWSAAPSLPATSAEAAALRSSMGTVFLIGGKSSNVTSQVLSLASGASSWNKAPNLDQERTGMGIGLLANGNIAVFGGLNRSQRLASAISYNPNLKSNNTAALAPLSVARSSLGYSTDSAGNLYAIGGLTDSGTTASVEMYSPTNQAWTARAPLPEALSDLAAISDGGNFLYAFGGTTPSGTLSSNAYRYSISANRWDPIAAISTIPGNFAPSCNSSNSVVLGPDDKIFLACGPYVMAYHIVGDFWTYETVVQAQGRPALVLDDQGRLLAIGGNIGTQVLKTVYVSTPLAEPASAPRFINPQFFGTLLNDVAFQYRLIVEGSPHATFSLITSPAGMTIDSVGGLIAWTPSLAQLGDNLVTVRATNTRGSSDTTFTIPVIGPTPPAPSVPVASEVTETSLRLTWGAVTSPSGPITYKVFVRQAVCSGRGFCSFTVIASTSDTTAVISNLVPGQTRPFYVTATAGGSQSTPSPVLLATTLQPATPSTLVASNVTQTSVGLSWQATPSAVPIVGYRLYENGLQLQNNIAGLSTTINGLGIGSVHNFEIRAFDANGVESRGSFLSLTTLFPPAISHQNVYPAEQVVAVVGEPMMVIAATTPLTSSVGANFSVKANGWPTPTFSVASAPAGLTVDATTGLLAWTPASEVPGAYSVTIRASNSEGVSDLTFVINVFAAGSDLLIPTIVPTYQTLTNVTSSSASFTWIPATDNKAVTGYNIYSQTPPTNCFRGGGCSGGQVIKAGVAGPDASFTITGLTPNTSYAIWFEPFDAAGNVANQRIGQVLPLLRLNTLP